MTPTASTSSTAASGGWDRRRLLVTLLPNIVAVVVCVVLLFLMVGPQALAEMMQTVEQAGAQAAPDPSLFTSWPIGRLMLEDAGRQVVCH